MTSTALQSTHPLSYQVGMLTVSRTIMNTGYRMIYPLLPVLARGVGVELATLALVLTVSQLFGLAAPAIGTLSERRGRRTTILLGLLLNTMALPIVFIIPNIIGLALALWIISLAKITFDPAVQAYIGDRVAYERRGLMLGIVEIAWSAAFLIGVPAMTWLIARSDWRAPFAALTVLSALSFIVAFLLLDHDAPKKKHDRPSFADAFRVAINSRAAVAGLVLAFGISAGNQLISVVFANWIELSFGVALATLAAASVVIGASELIGEGFVMGLSDRIGKRRLVIIAVVVNLAACFVLPFTGFSLTTALFGLFLFYLSFETALVGTLPLATELSPHARAMYMTILVATFTVSRAAMTPIAPYLLEVGFWLNALIAAVLNIIALVAVTVYITLD